MNKIASVIFGIIAIGNVIYSFWKYSDSTAFFGFEVNVWIYRIFWGLVAIYMFYSSQSNKKKVK